MYPEFCPVPFNEDNLWAGYPEPTNAHYGVAKRTLLMLAQSYRAQYGIKGSFLMPVNLYGREDHYDDLVNSHVIPALINKFVSAKEQGLPFVICWGTGEVTREFLFADDAADAIALAVNSEFDSAQPINLGTGKNISIKNLAHLIKELTSYEGEIVFNGAVSNGQPDRRLDVSRAKELLHWEAKVSLRDGLRQSIDWYIENKKIN